MDEDEVREQDEQESGARVDQEAVQERGQLSGEATLRKLASKMLRENVAVIFTAIGESIRKGHLPSVKLLVDLANKVEDAGTLLVSEVPSLAEVLRAGLHLPKKAVEVEKPQLVESTIEVVVPAGDGGKQ
jgi:hypothetical protein